MTFDQLNLDEKILKSLQAMHYETMLPIQEAVFDKMMKKKDCIVQSKTGSGKTLSYVLPIVQQLEIDEKAPQAMVLAPTRELAQQIKEEFDAIGCFKKIKSICCTGKQSFSFQQQDLHQRVHVIVGTPGRILDHLQQGNIQTHKIQFLILDEADEMLNQDFIEQIQNIYTYLNKDICSCIFSATFPEKIKNMTQDFLDNPEWISIQDKNQIDEFFIKVEEEQKKERLIHVLSFYQPESCIIFCSTQKRCEDLYTYCHTLSISCNRIHAGLKQEQRFSCMSSFKKGNIRILIATDVASRGIDIQKVDLIIHFDMPDTPYDYIHRIGRSARVHEKGMSICFESKSDLMRSQKLMDYGIKKQYIDIPREQNLENLEYSVRKNRDKYLEVKKNIVKLYINAGKSKKIRAGDIVGSILQIDGMEKDDIGIIQIQDHQSFVEIFNGKEELVIENLKTIKKKKIRIEFSKMA
ncbi:DEAD/DEAH box helicase [Floccifex sp.]|uniref:DEAD/DEAH box helicase n=1 Tax=Floccifex sp. TaxID=2815810 RepID=UPI003F0AFC70